MIQASFALGTGEAYAPCQRAGCTGTVTFTAGVDGTLPNGMRVDVAACPQCGERHVRDPLTGMAATRAETVKPPFVPAPTAAPEPGPVRHGPFWPLETGWRATWLGRAWDRWWWYWQDVVNEMNGYPSRRGHNYMIGALMLVAFVAVSVGGVLAIVFALWWCRWLIVNLGFEPGAFGIVVSAMVVMAVVHRLRYGPED